MLLLFRGLNKGSPLQRLDLQSNEFGIDGIRSMVPFLTNARNLRTLSIGENSNINTECFRLLVEALHVGGTIKDLLLVRCNIDDITALENYPLPHLKILTLGFNNIRSIPSSMENYTNLEQLNLNSNKLGREGCRSIAKLLEKGGSRLKEIFLAATDTSDEEAVVIANSLKFNTS